MTALFARNVVWRLSLVPSWLAVANVTTIYAGCVMPCYRLEGLFIIVVAVEWLCWLKLYPTLRLLALHIVCAYIFLKFILFMLI